MKKIRKLTPQVLKKIIAEERKKLRNREQSESTKDRNLINEIKAIKALIKLKKAQQKKLAEFKKLYEARKKLKKSLVKGL